MRVLLTGAGGQVGRRLLPRLLARRTGVRVLVRDPARAAAFAALGAEPVLGDLRDPVTLPAAVRGVDAVLNAAAAFRDVPDDEQRATNHRGAVALGRAAADAGVPCFVQVSTNLVYGAGRGRPALESDPCEPGGPRRSVYAETKLAAERDLFALRDRAGLDVRVARLAFVYGEGDPHLAEALARVATWPGHQRLPMVHHADASQALIRLLSPAVPGDVYNVADDAPVTAAELRLLHGEPERGGAELPGGGPAFDPWFGVISTLRARDELGFRPLYPTVWTARDAGAL
jgi:nucleoside-diphosphate-sugar epimerase